MKLLLGIVFALTVLSAPVYIHLQKADATLVTASVEPQKTRICAGYAHFDEPECDDGTTLPPWKDVRDTFPEATRNLIDFNKPSALDVAMQADMIGEKVCDTICEWEKFNKLPYEEQIKDGHYVRTDFGTFMNYLVQQRHER